MLTAMQERDNRVCACGHLSVSHGSFALVTGAPVPVGEGPCGFCSCTELH